MDALAASLFLCLRKWSVYSCQSSSSPSRLLSPTGSLHSLQLSFLMHGRKWIRHLKACFGSERTNI